MSDEKRSIQLSPSRFAQTEHENTSYTVTCEPSMTIEDVLKPEFWSHVSTKLRAYDKICVRTDQGDWYAELLVLTPARNWAAVTLLFKKDLSTKDVDQSKSLENDGFDVNWGGPHLKWRVVRKQDSQTIKDHCETKENASTWLREHLKATT